MADYTYYIGKQVKLEIRLRQDNPLVFSGIVEDVNSKFLILTDKYQSRQTLPIDKITYISEIMGGYNGN